MKMQPMNPKIIEFSIHKQDSISQVGLKIGLNDILIENKRFTEIEVL